MLHLSTCARLGLGPRGSLHPRHVQPRAQPRPARSRSAPAQTRSQVQLLAARDDVSTLRLPLDFIAILTTVSEQKGPNERHANFSPGALTARSEILEGARATLRDPGSQARYAQRVQRGEVEERVPSRLVPGALLLLLEAGRARDAAEAGQRWLSQARRGVREAQDVALATGLGLCDAAADHLAQTGRVAETVHLLEEAAGVLHKHRAGSSLQADIRTAVQELETAVVMELLGAGKEGRVEGLRRARQILLSSGGRHGEAPTSSPSAPPAPSLEWRSKFLADLTPQELMAFHEGVGHSAAGTSMDLYRISTAYIGFATLTRRPALLIAALSCLDAADAMEDAAPGTAPGQAPQDARRAVEERQRRSVARAAARLLLGDTEAAKAALGWQQGRPADRQVAAFVKANSPDPSDPLPGLCALVERWVSGVAWPYATSVGQEPGQAEGAFSINAWFGDAAVQAYLSSPRPHGDSQPSLAERLAGGTEAVLAWLGSLPIPSRGVRLLGTGPAVCLRPSLGLARLEGEELMWDAGKRRRPRWGRFLAAGASILAGVALASRLPGLTQGPRQPVSPAAETAHPADSTLSGTQALQLIKRWQLVRAAALGVKHDARSLPTILGGELLATWQERTKQLAAQNWHYDQALDAVKLLSVKPGSSPYTAVVRARLSESLVAHQGRDAAPVAQRKEYTVRYVVEKRGSGWIILEADIEG
ncbi:Protein ACCUMULATION AND REPLICATION OF CHLOROPLASTS 6, chloroplastic [Auxenochlorella protothecoides]|uniref:Protein ACCUMULATION AND REPLICATION OF CHLOROPLASTS 6, chloroplastic n=1 Tax=Auxenochlorella protothecoides TaxID=3075 RepID=A0A087SU37_AUXPR|nr:Protein ACCUMULATION AND REPLICATION OF CHLOROPLASTS 6, chloroplastic [Auxenochlorella protothecoides]KFM29241.1 Protein ACCUMULATION AND REPLICATION OF CHLOROPLASTS 6, chloroplastic [Auxenochlorella protothecoides]